MKKLVLLVGIILTIYSCQEQESKTDISIIPKPLKIEVTKQSFSINKNTAIVFQHGDDGFEKAALYLKDEILKNLNLDLKVTTTENYSGNNSVVLDQEEDAGIGLEGYLLDVSKKNVSITAQTPNGVFYGVQTLLQLLSNDIPEKENQFGNVVKGVKIYDKPRFEWRGMHLDVCRHFYDKEFVKRYIDLLAMHKMNTFHWHLTEDQGWRIEIKKYPKLTEVGSFRDETVIGKNSGKFDGIPHSGFYSQEDIKEIVQYASDRFITIVPEIEMPGHSLAALAAYPEYGCAGGPYKVAKTWGVFEDVYCAGNDKTFEFLENVLAEVVQLFPGKYIHIGGDECPKKQWEVCSKCQKRIKDEGLENEFELQSYFIRRVEKYLLANDKKLIGWDEILEGGLAPEATVMSWRGTEGGIKSAKMGHYVVMSPNDECYFDHYQGEPESEPFAIGGFTSLEDVYKYEPIPKELSEAEAKYILGAQANVWTEYIVTEEHLEYMILPRMCALSEVVWTDSESKNYESFLKSLSTHLKRLERKSYNYRPI